MRFIEDLVENSRLELHAVFVVFELNPL